MKSKLLTLFMFVIGCSPVGAEPSNDSLLIKKLSEIQLLMEKTDATTQRNYARKRLAFNFVMAGAAFGAGYVLYTKRLSEHELADASKINAQEHFIQGHAEDSFEYYDREAEHRVQEGIFQGASMASIGIGGFFLIKGILGYLSERQKWMEYVDARPTPDLSGGVLTFTKKF